MKTTLFSLIFLLLISCTTENVKYSCTKGVIRILDKQKRPRVRGSGDCYFAFYLYDGKKAYWCETDRETYPLYNINDTLPTLVITKTIIEK